MDLCNFIPRELVDVAILEEPEHLNWFRMPNSKEESKRCLSNTMDGDEDDAGSEEQSGGDDESTTPSSVGESGVLGQKVEVTINESPSNDIAEVLEKPDAAANVAANVGVLSAKNLSWRPCVPIVTQKWTNVSSLFVNRPDLQKTHCCILCQNTLFSPK